MLEKIYGYDTLNDYCTKNNVSLHGDYTQCMSTTRVTGKCLQCVDGVFEKKVIDLITYGHMELTANLVCLKFTYNG